MRPGEERRIALEDPLLQPRQQLAGLQTQLRSKPPARPLISLEGIRLAARAIQSQHQLTPHLLLKRMLTGKPLEFRHQLPRGPGRQRRIQP